MRALSRFCTQDGCLFLHDLEPWGFQVHFKDERSRTIPSEVGVQNRLRQAFVDDAPDYDVPAPEEIAVFSSTEAGWWKTTAIALQDVWYGGYLKGAGVDLFNTEFADVRLEEVRPQWRSRAAGSLGRLGRQKVCSILRILRAPRRDNGQRLRYLTDLGPSTGPQVYESMLRHIHPTAAH